MIKVLTVIGTRPEAIKLAPVIAELGRRADAFESIVGLTGQHDDLLDGVLGVFGIRPDFNLRVMRPDQRLGDVTAAILTAMGRRIAELAPDVVVVQGDTTTVFATALAAFFERVPVAHVEAGLRTADRRRPFPEEIFRRLTDGMADLYFAPTETNRAHLLREGVPDAAIHVTGNTVIDALRSIARSPRPASLPTIGAPGARRILLTLHRRENFGRPLRDVFAAVETLCRRHADVHVVYPVHPNPNVAGPAHEALGGLANVTLLPPADYVSFAHLMQEAHLILTDSGGVQEEAPTFGKPVLILRETTERTEVVAAGGARLVGTDTRRIVEEATRLLEDPAHYHRMASVANPFGDGAAARRIADVLSESFHQQLLHEHPHPRPAAAA